LWSFFPKFCFLHQEKSGNSAAGQRATKSITIKNPLKCDRSTRKCGLIYITIPKCYLNFFAEIYDNVFYISILNCNLNFAEMFDITYLPWQWFFIYAFWNAV
jgi:hypothetical protein